MKHTQHDLYPPLTPYAAHDLPVGDGHRLYVEQCGHADGIPAVFLHGGPGAGCEAAHRRFFDPDRYRIVLFDQRGCGRSTPHAALEANQADSLIAWVNGVRDSITSYRLRRIASTRLVEQAVKALRSGKTMADVKARYFQDWSRDEIAKVGGEA